jgi:hypothetical protein
MCQQCEYDGRPCEWHRPASADEMSETPVFPIPWGAVVIGVAVLMVCILVGVVALPFIRRG